jgi:hypothetical protein
MRKILQKSFPLAVAILIIACASEPKNNNPDWIKNPTRVVDNGYIVYVGSAQEMKPDLAFFKAEGMALEDLANECSVIPKGTRIEDRFSLKNQYTTTAYVKLAVDFPACEQAKNAGDPDSIRRIANVSFTQQLKRYQDLAEGGDFVASNQGVSTTPPDEWPESIAQVPSNSPHASTVQFYVLRQYVVYQKETVILAPPQYFAANSPESQKLIRSLGSTNQQITTLVAQNPILAKPNQAWSQVPNRPLVQRPGNLKPQTVRRYDNPIRPPAQPPRAQAPQRQNGKLGGKKRRKRHLDPDSQN